MQEATACCLSRPPSKQLESSAQGCICTFAILSLHTPLCHAEQQCKVALLAEAMLAASAVCSAETHTSSLRLCLCLSSL